MYYSLFLDSIGDCSKLLRLSSPLALQLLLLDLLGAGLFGAFLFRNVLMPPSSCASTASMILCLHSFAVSYTRLGALGHERTRSATRCCTVLRDVRFEHVEVTCRLSLVKLSVMPALVLLRARDCRACLCSLVEAPTASLATQAARLRSTSCSLEISGSFQS